MPRSAPAADEYVCVCALSPADEASLAAGHEGWSYEVVVVGETSPTRVALFWAASAADAHNVVVPTLRGLDESLQLRIFAMSALPYHASIDTSHCVQYRSRRSPGTTS